MSKKDFSKNPALQFVSGANQQKTDEIPEGYKRNPEFIQKKTRRVQLLMQEELYKKAKAHADAVSTHIALKFCHSCAMNVIIQS